MTELYKQQNHILLGYTPEDDNNDWVSKELDTNDEVTFKRTFTFTPLDLTAPGSDLSVDYSFDNPAYTFILASREGNYYHIEKGILTDKFDLYIHNDVPISLQLFVADSNVSIFQKLASIVDDQPIYIGGNHSSAIPWDAFQTLLNNFPTAYEKKKYVEARVSAVLRDYVDGMKDAEKAYHAYLNKKTISHQNNLLKAFKEAEIEKFQTILEKLENMLKSEDGYSEKQWQEEILQILLLLYPKYIAVFREVPVKDETIEDRFLDYLLVDSGGFIDIVEIKRPFNKCIITENKYRNNYIPLRELSGTIMQIEKYIFYLNRWSFQGEKYLTNKFKDQLPAAFKIRITNPSGIIIMGRENNLTPEQKADFEVVKRKYKNVVDIITYDNLVYRLKTTIEQMQKL